MPYLHRRVTRAWPALWSWGKSLDCLLRAGVMKLTDLKHRHMRRRLVERLLRRCGITKKRAVRIASQFIF